MSNATAGPANLPLDLARYWSIEQFLYREARLLDEDRLHEWYELLAEDIHYSMPVRHSRYLGDTLDHAIDVDHYDDDHTSMRFRIERVTRRGIASMDPPARVSRLISNIEVTPGERAGEYRVYSVFQLSLNRLFDREEALAGRREDILREDGNGSYKIASRRVLINQNVVLSRNLAAIV